MGNFADRKKHTVDCTANPMFRNPSTAKELLAMYNCHHIKAAYTRSTKSRKRLNAIFKGAISESMASTYRLSTMCLIMALEHFFEPSAVTGLYESGIKKVSLRESKDIT